MKINEHKIKSQSVSEQTRFPTRYPTVFVTSLFFCFFFILHHFLQCIISCLKTAERGVCHCQHNSYHVRYTRSFSTTTVTFRMPSDRCWCPLTSSNCSAHGSSSFANRQIVATCPSDRAEPNHSLKSNNLPT